MDSKRSLRTVSVEFRKKNIQGREQANLSSFSEKEGRGEKEKSPISYRGKSEKGQNIRKSTLRERQKKKESYSTLSKLEKAGRLRSHMAVVQ